MEPIEGATLTLSRIGAVVWLEATVGLLAWAGVALMIDALSRWRRHVDLTERLHPYQPTAVADEADRWLHQH